MIQRKKTKIERFLSLNQHLKRLGVTNSFCAKDQQEVSALKNNKIEGNTVTYNQGANKKITQHLENLKTEFAGQSELLYYHAQLIVLLRREYKTQEIYGKLKMLWELEEAFLLEKLNLRWLISAADSFSDHSTDEAVKALSLCTSLLFNTVKLYETERFLTVSENTPISPERKNKVTSERVELFDGTAAFVVGTDDTLRNLRWRIDSIKTTHPIKQILLEVFRRLQNEDSVYQRFRQLHTNTRTEWW